MKCRDLEPQKQDANNNPKTQTFSTKSLHFFPKTAYWMNSEKAVPCCGHNILIYTNLQFQNDQREQLPIHRLPNSEEQQTEEGLLSNYARDSTSVTKVRFHISWKEVGCAKTNCTPCIYQKILYSKFWTVFWRKQFSTLKITSSTDRTALCTSGATSVTCCITIQAVFSLSRT